MEQLGTPGVDEKQRTGKMQYASVQPG